MEFGAAEGDQRHLLEAQLGPEDGDLERRRVDRVADERVGERQRHRVHCPSRADSEVLLAVAAEILHRAEQTRPRDMDAHCCSAIRANSFPVTARKRTRSPGANRLGRGRPASNTASGVRPITFQPPEIA